MAIKLSLTTFFNSLNTKNIVLKYLVIIFLGALNFYFDDREIVNPAMNTLFIFDPFPWQDLLFLWSRCDPH